MNWGIVLTIFAPMIMDPKSEMLPSGTSPEARTIWVGVLLAIFALGQFIMAPVIGAFSNQYGRKKVLIGTLWGSFFFNAFSAIGIWADSMTLLFLSRLLAGAASGNLPLAQASIADMSTPENEGKRMSLVGVVGGISWIIAPPLLEENWPIPISSAGLIMLLQFGLWHFHFWPMPYGCNGSFRKRTLKIHMRSMV